MSQRIVFACVHNAGRSQMAAEFFNSLADPQCAHATSAGTSPVDCVHPEVVSVMREVGVDLSSRRPQRLTEDLARGADLLITMGCGDTCPYVPGKRYEDWELEDPAGQGLDAVRPIRDEIERRVRTLLASLDVTES